MCAGDRGHFVEIIFCAYSKTIHSLSTSYGVLTLTDEKLSFVILVGWHCWVYAYSGIEDFVVVQNIFILALTEMNK